MTEILIKRLSKTVSMPKYETTGSSGMDLAADIDEKIEIKPGETQIIPTGLSLSIPKEFEIQIRPRSGLAAKYQLSVLNTPGTIDADYRGEIGVILVNHGSTSIKLDKGERIGQLVLNKVEQIVWEENLELQETERGEGGFGSTGTK